MIEVRISHRDLMEYRDQQSAEAYIRGKLTAAGADLDKPGYFEQQEDPCTLNFICRWHPRES